MIKTISRRTVLRGTGAAIALPMLEIMTSRLRADESSSDKVARMVCIYTPHGVRNSTWYPEKTGFGYTMSSLSLIHISEPTRRS